MGGGKGRTGVAAAADKVERVNGLQEREQELAVRSKWIFFQQLRDKKM